MSRRFTGLMLSLMLAVMLAGITPRTASAKTDLQVTWWGSQSRHDRTIKVIKMYMDAHPDLNITYEFSGWDDYWTRLNTQAAGGQLPCIMQQDYAYVQEWATRKLLLPLDDYLKDGTIDTKNIAEASLKGGRVDGKLYAVNLGNNSQSFVLDLDAFKKAGLDLPPAQWTWKDFEKIAMQLHDKLGIWAIGNGLDDVQLWKSLYLGYGQWAFTHDGTALGYDNDQPLIDFYKMILRLQTANAIPSRAEDIQFTKLSIEAQPIVASKAAMASLWSNQVVAVWTAAGDKRNFKLWPLPRPEGGKSENYIKPSQFFSITANCKNPQEAAKLIDYFTNSAEANDVLFAERGIPISSAIRDHLTPKLTPAQAETFDYLSRIEKDNSPIRPPDPAHYGDVLNNVFTPLFVDPVLYGQITPEEGAKALREQANEILSKNKTAS
jgi:multiple sugar transport system substrate-binding protein